MSHNSFGHLFRVTTWGREPRPGDRLRDRRLPAAPEAVRGRHPAVPRPPPPRPVEVHHPARRAGPGAHPVRRPRGRRHRRADRDGDRERGPALEGLRRDRAPVQARPRGPRVRAEIRRARPSRRRPQLGAGDGDAGGRRRRGASGARTGGRDPRRADADGAARGGPRALGLGGGRAEPVLLPGQAGGGGVGHLSDGREKSRLLRRRGDRGLGRRRAARLGARRSTPSSTPTSPAP